LKRTHADGILTAVIDHRARSISMSHQSKPVILSGRLDQILFSPKGALEGLLVNMGAQTVQVSMEPTTANAEALANAVGKAIELKASVDDSQKAKHGAHPVYKMRAVSKIAGKAFTLVDEPERVQGVVSAIHFAKHGEPNGVMLESGEFVHTRPHGMKKLKLKIGSKVVALGQVRMTVLGTPLLEAEEVNRISIE
jgi:hypothetical protein